VTLVPPTVGPLLGDIDVTDGGGAASKGSAVIRHKLSTNKIRKITITNLFFIIKFYINPY
jgi:hypothetical protein